MVFMLVSYSLDVLFMLMTSHCYLPHATDCKNLNPARTDLLINSDHKPKKLGQSDLVCWVYRSSCLYSCAASRASQPGLLVL